MRHYLCLAPALAQGTLPFGMMTRSAVAQLVAFTGAALGLTPADLGALTRTIQIAVVTIAADAHLRCAVPAAIQPIRLLAVLHVPRAALDKAAQHWHKGKANAPLNARAQVEGPGFRQELVPGLRLSSVREQDTAIAPWCGHGICIRHFVTAASATAFDSVRQNRQTRPGQTPNRDSHAKSTANDSEGFSRQSPKSRGFQTSFTIATNRRTSSSLRGGTTLPERHA
jgi:hypothetical protein